MKGEKTYMLRSDNEDYNVFSVDKTFQSPRQYTNADVM